MADTKNLKVVITAEDRFSNVLDNAKKKTGDLGGAFRTLGKSAIAMGAASTLALGGIIKVAVNFEDSFAGIRKTVDATEEEFADLEGRIRSMAKELPTSTTELNKIGEIAGQLGVSGVDNLEKFIETVAAVAVTTNLTSEVAATAFARIANVMPETIDDIDRMASSAVALGNNFATTEAEIVTFAQRLGDTANIVGSSTADILAYGAAFSSAGIQAEAGGTAVSKIMREMHIATIDGGSGLEKFAKTAGMTASEFKKAYEKDATGAFVSFVDGLGKEGDKAFAILEELGLQDARLIRSIMAVAGSENLLRDAVEMSNKAYEENTALTEEAEKRYKTTASQLKMLRNRTADVGITIGSALLPQIISLVDRLGPAIEGFSRFASEHPKLIVGALGLSAALGGLSLVIFALGPAISALITVFSALAFTGIPALISAFSGLSFAMMATPIGAMIVIGAALAITLTTLATKTDIFKTQTDLLRESDERLIDTQNRLKGANDNLEQANVRADRAAFNHKVTTNRLKEAEEDATKALEEYGIESEQYIAASLLVEDAKLSERQANIDLKDAIGLAIDAEEEKMVADDELKAGLNEHLQVLAAEETAWGKLTNTIGDAISKLKDWYNSKKKYGYDSDTNRVTENRRHGGVVPGGMNQAVPAVLHGGERVVSRTGVDVNPTQGGGSSININFNGPIGVRNDSDIDAIAMRVKSVIDRENSLYQQGVL